MVDAVVTDKDGHPVKDLTAADFTVTENKKPQKIASFSYEDFATKAKRSAPGALPANVTTNRTRIRHAARPAHRSAARCP